MILSNILSIGLEMLKCPDPTSFELGSDLGLSTIEGRTVGSQRLQTSEFTSSLLETRKWKEVYDSIKDERALLLDLIKSASKEIMLRKDYDMGSARGATDRYNEFTGQLGELDMELFAALMSSSTPDLLWENRSEVQELVDSASNEIRLRVDYSLGDVDRVKERYNQFSEGLGQVDVHLIKVLSTNGTSD